MEIEEIKVCVYGVLLKTDKLHKNMENCIDFAHILLTNNIESENIYILAGLNKNEYYDIKKYFENVLNELKINVGINDRYLGLEFLTLIANEVINGKKNPKEAVRELNTYNDNLFYNENFVFNDYRELEECIDLIIYNNISIIPDINKDNVDEYIKHHFELFLKIKDLDISQNIYEQAYCKKCGKRIKPKIIKKIFKKYFELKCPECSSIDFYWIKYNTGMEMYLKEIGKM